MTSRDDIAIAADTWMRGLGTGPLAGLRRMTPDRIAPAGWHLSARHDIGAADRDRWVVVFRIIASLIPRGDPATRPPVSRRVGLGQALADGGQGDDWRPDRDANGEATPLFSQARMQQLLMARGEARLDLMARACAMLGRSLPSGCALRAQDIARAVFHPDDAAFLAKPYYTRLIVRKDEAHRKDENA